ncbi:RelA/SpoT domain-containing protein [Flavobacterium lindanitolerans]|uniref:RelA/SpoT family protein n=1 Tax=Flavobacterium lindanitolerans TaxID=428988 RepID=A0A497U3H9_9FLAO|nr:RelA/SpoT domain-containing protein [Flavobacterium lindanitolerans]PKW30047.1 RelA/SpoT family protein [Flavobacterium lindanitolerans]RLJ24387.1 RelA/SpoT family protein [Flavobacterium lindanitolerans]
MNAGFKIIEREILEKIKDELDKIGMFYRLFGRIKDDKSIKEKISRKFEEGQEYKIEGKKIQDLLGIRVVTYFKDDIILVKEILSKKFDFIDEEIDELDLTVFKPKRTNIICEFSNDQKEVMQEVKKATQNIDYELIDDTFELQLRTVLSEGWHEIDHGLRYKCKLDWQGRTEEERMLNGIYATLETNDIVLKNLFNELAYKHFKNNNWEALMRTKFRLKFQMGSLNSEIIDILDKKMVIGKKILKLDRIEVLKKIAKSDFSLPVNLNNLFYLINGFEIKDEDVFAITPELIISFFKKQ